MVDIGTLVDDIVVNGAMVDIGTLVDDIVVNGTMVDIGTLVDDIVVNGTMVDDIVVEVYSGVLVEDKCISDTERSGDCLLTGVVASLVDVGVDSVNLTNLISLFTDVCRDEEFLLGVFKGLRVCGVPYEGI